LKPALLFLLFGLTLASLGLTGCATVRSFEGFDVSLVNVRFVQSTVWETTAIFTVRLQNESPDPVTLTGGMHKFYLDGSFLGEGLSNQPLTLERLSSGTQDITVHLRNLSLARKLKPIIEQQRFDYRVDSVLYFDSASRYGRGKVSHTGQLDLREFQPTPPAGR
jgi:LEA14-like dessication related protein